ncbi:MAG: PKD-like family lipoprotein [Prevotella sp.]|nr:PKD-like family lipoprotein [Prevotella sp.]MDD7046723.1 PKD-like family lipoprotein [Prevotella sp.]MDY5547047.1 PKD-like family lipoprotein [Prevotella sp.]
MKRTNILTAVSLALLSLVTSCASDDGNYDYTKLNELSIGDIETKYTIEQNSELTVSPSITGTQGFNEQDYDYKWFIYKVNSVALPDTIGKEKDLHAVITLSPGEYDLVFRAIDRSNDIFAQKKVTVNVVNSYSNGVAVLSDVDGYADLAFINSIGRVTENAYETINGRKAGKGPLGIFYTGGATSQKLLVISTQDSCFALEPISMKYMLNHNKRMFYFPSAKGVTQGFAIGSSHFSEYIVVDGGVYKRSFWDEVPLLKYETKMGGDYVASPYILANDGYVFIYDTKGKRFLFDDYNAWGELVGTPDNPYFNAADMKMDMLYGTCYKKSDVSEVRAVMKDGDGNVYGISGQKDVTWGENYEEYVKLIPTGKVQFDKEGTDNATCYALSSQDINFMYCAVGNKIVCISMKTGNVISTYTMPEGTIDHMEFDDTDSPDILYVGTSDGSKSAKSGSVYYLQMQSDGTLSLQKSFKNICGKVVDFVYK